MANNYTSSHIGNLAQSGKDFNILASNVPYKMLSNYDTAVRKASNDSSTSNYDISGKISNSIIICAPQERDNTTVYTQWTKFTYEDNDNNGTFSNDDLMINTYSYATVENKVKDLYKDTGDFDLVVTDDDGVPVCLTPPFNDIDTDYFTVRKNIEHRNRGYCNSNALTMSESFRDTLGNTAKTLDNLIFTYTPIVPNQDKTIYLISTYKVGNPNNKNYYVGYAGTNGNITISNKDNKWTYSYHPNANDTITNDERTTFTRVSFSYLLDWNIALQQWKDKEFNDNDKIDSKWDRIGSSTNKKISYLLDQVTKLTNYKYMFQLNGSSTSYVWTGSKSQYDNMGSNQRNRNNATFIINDK